MILLFSPFVLSFALGLDVYLPITPIMTKIFNTSPSVIHLTLSIFLLMTGFSQIFIGPIADRYGRKFVLYFSSFSFAFGSLLCAIAPSIFWLLVGRFISALGASGLLVTPFAIIRDSYSGDEKAKMYSFITGAIGISPALAPVVGSYLFYYFGYQSIFLFLTFIGLINLFLTYFFLKETMSLKNCEKENLLTNYTSILTSKPFLYYTSLAGIAQGVFFCFFSISPFILIEINGVEPHHFGYYFAIFGISGILAGYAGGILIEKRGSQSILLLGIWLILIGGISVIFWYYLVGISLMGFLLPMVISSTGAVFLLGATASGALEPFPQCAGTAAAAYGALQFAIASLIGSTLMQIPIVTTLPYGFAIILCGLCAFVINKKRILMNQTI